MANNGKFIIDKFKGQRVEIFLNSVHEWIKYSDGDAMAYTIISAVPTNYDIESGVLTMLNDKNQEFYINEVLIQMFWKAGSGFNIIENTNSTLYPGSKKRDFM